eukprot:8091031-Pyramimonas_sp.AAC.1
MVDITSLRLPQDAALDSKHVHVATRAAELKHAVKTSSKPAARAKAKAVTKAEASGNQNPKAKHLRS